MASSRKTDLKIKYKDRESLCWPNSDRLISIPATHLPTDRISIFLVSIILLKLHFWCLQWTPSVFLICVFLSTLLWCIYFFLYFTFFHFREREWGRGAKGEKEGIPSRLYGSWCGAWSHDCGIITWAEIKTLDRLSHPDTPMYLFFMLLLK